MDFFYNFFIYPILHFCFFVLSFFNSKIRTGFKLRKNKSWIRPFQDKTGSPISWVWFHVASGELEYAKPVIRLLKNNPLFKPKILVTYFSPSVVSSLEKTAEVDLFVPMPWDTPRHWQEFLNHYRPRVLAISRTDTWPNLVWQSYRFKIPSILFSATLPKSSGRVSSFWGRLFYASIFEKLSAISCVSENDKENFLRLSDELEKIISVDGDTRFDQAIARVDERRPHPLWTEKLSGNIFVVGSSWPEDEREILPALAGALKSFKFTSLVAPHEPTEHHLKSLEGAFKALGVKTQRYSILTDPSLAPVVLIDKVGVLADLYRFGSLAFVGGSFKKSIHSVMEPAASGAFTFFGPFHHNNREALALRGAGLAREVASSAEIQNLIVENFCMSSEESAKRREKILKFVHANKGVSEKIAMWILKESK